MRALEALGMGGDRQALEAAAEPNPRRNPSSAAGKAARAAPSSARGRMFRPARIYLPRLASGAKGRAVVRTCRGRRNWLGACVWGGVRRGRGGGGLCVPCLSGPAGKRGAQEGRKSGEEWTSEYGRHSSARAAGQKEF